MSCVTWSVQVCNSSGYLLIFSSCFWRLVYSMPSDRAHPFTSCLIPIWNKSQRCIMEHSIRRAEYSCCNFRTWNFNSFSDALSFSVDWVWGTGPKAAVRLNIVQNAGGDKVLVTPPKEVGLSRFHGSNFQRICWKIEFKLRDIIVCQEIIHVNCIAAFAHIFHELLPSLIDYYFIWHSESVPGDMHIKWLVGGF